MSLLRYRRHCDTPSSLQKLESSNPPNSLPCYKPQSAYTWGLDIQSNSNVMMKHEGLFGRFSEVLRSGLLNVLGFLRFDFSELLNANLQDFDCKRHHKERLI